MWKFIDTEKPYPGETAVHTAGKANEMKNILLIGTGRFGRYAVRKLTDLGHSVMVVDKNEKRINKIKDEATSAQIGDASSSDFLKTLGIRDFDLCIVCIGDSFLDALEITSLLKDLGAKKVISRASSEKEEKFLLRNGADFVVFPERQMANWMAIRYSSDHIKNYIDVCDGYSIYEIDIPPQWDLKKIGDIDVRKNYGFSILGIRNGKMNMNPLYDTVLRKEDTMLVLGREADLRKLLHMLR